MNATIQATLDGKKLKINGNNGNKKELRLEEVFISHLLLAKTIEGDTYRDILKKISTYAPMIRLKNEAMIRKVLEKMENLEMISTINTSSGLIVNSKDPEAETEARDFLKEILKFGDFLNENP